MSIQHDVKNLNLADEGRKPIDWADQQMPVLRLIRHGHELCQPISVRRVHDMMNNAKSLEKKVYSVPLPMDKEIARIKLHSMGVAIDQLTAKQEKYLTSWEEGN